MIVMLVTVGSIAALSGWTYFVARRSFNKGVSVGKTVAIMELLVDVHKAKASAPRESTTPTH